ncbi:phytanoyl-CoA dioxygenase family protein [Sphingobium sp. EM0848]|uniref:phytanoyl-CoA dioxygenase family protein n=1 Tax=Sphingobium sp. EM0848 TaxID=2743473 RepID=UPI00159C3318|nr:phytanoyl-CoA dioxygenase family protein [Sphingobium sp. EM0848]
MIEEATYHSKFGGLWIDRSDWRQEITARGLDATEASMVTDFVDNGYVILEGAAPHHLVDAFQRKIELAFREGNDQVLYQKHGQQVVQYLNEPADRKGGRVVDSFVPLSEALDLFSVPRLMNFFKLIFDAHPLLFQSLSFDQGSQQGLHQDTAYVVVNRPLELAACWIALEDVRPGSGQLVYAPGSHRRPDWDFGGNKKHWDPSQDGPDTHNAWSVDVAEQAKRSDRGIVPFYAKKGDILIWHADLAHGGAPVENDDLTRQSLVGHFCPQTAAPYYFSTNPEHSVVKQFGDLAYSSQHYRL